METIKYIFKNVNKLLTNNKYVRFFNNPFCNIPKVQTNSFVYFHKKRPIVSKEKQVIYRVKTYRTM